MLTRSGSKLTAGLIGCGRIGAFTPQRTRSALPVGWLPLSHAEAIVSSEYFTLLSVCDTDPGSAKQAMDTYRAARSYTDYRQLVLDDRPDIVAIATRTPERPTIVEFCARHGVRGIHAEKPLSRNLKDCRHTLDVLREHGVKLSYGVLRRYSEIYAHAREIVSSGEIGEVMEITVQHGRAPLFWSHPHSADLLLYFAGSTEIDYIQSSCTFTTPVSPDAASVDDDPLVDFAAVKFVNGVTGIISSAGGMHTLIAGTRGTVSVQNDGTGIEIRRPADDRSPYYLHVDCHTARPRLSCRQAAFNDLAEAILEGKQQALKFDEIETAQKILLAMVLSALRSGARVRPSEVDEDFTVTGRSGDKYA